MTFETEDIARITSEACAMFGLEVVHDDEEVGDLQALGGVIAITGGWEGVVAMACSAEFARRLAAVMFMMEADEMSEEEVNDAFGELVNVATGNIKALLPDGCRMGLPEVVHDLPTPANDDHVQRWGFSADGDHLTVVVRRAA